jgi:hypothetical protein
MIKKTMGTIPKRKRVLKNIRRESPSISLPCCDAEDLKFAGIYGVCGGCEAGLVLGYARRVLRINSLCFRHIASKLNSER